MTLAEHLFKRHRFDRLVMALGARWYLSYKLSYRDLVAMMAERGLVLAHTTIMRWVLKLTPTIEQRWRKYARPVGKSWRVDETYIKVKGRWVYLQGFKRFANASIVISGIELVGKLRKSQFNVARLIKRAPGDIHDLWLAVLVA